MKKMFFLSKENSNTKNDLVKQDIMIYLVHQKLATITEFSKLFNLSVPTITKFINELQKEGYITSFGKLGTSEGRHPIQYGLNPNSAYFVGVEIEHDYINIALINFKGDLIEEKMNIPYKPGNSLEGLKSLCEKVKKFIESLNIDTSRIININYNISGRTNHKTGYNYNHYDFSDEPLTDLIQKLTGFPSSIENSTRGAAYGEYLRGCVKDEKNVLFINLDWGLGLGIFVNGELYRGHSGFAGDWGHIVTFDNEIICHCGKKGCTETEISGQALLRRIKEKINNGENSVLAPKVQANKELTLNDAIEAILQEDILTIEIIEEIGNKLGKHLAGLINIFNPELVIIGGKLAKSEDYIIQPIKSGIRKYSLNLINKDTKIKISQLKEKAGIVGACMIARSKAIGETPLISKN